MMVLQVTVSILFVAVIILSIAFVALARQVGVLFERVAPVGALVTDTGPKIGEPAPRFDIPSLSGKPVEIGRRADRTTLVFFLAPSCPVCKKLIPAIRSIAAAESRWLNVVLASDGDIGAKDHAEFQTKAGLLEFNYVVSKEMGMAYRVARLPYAVLIDESGVIRAKGMVNNREQLESLFNAKEMKVGSIQQYLNDSTDSSVR